MSVPPHPKDRELLSREAVLTITVLVVSTFTVILNEMLMGVAMPRVMADLDITASTAQWLTTAYMLTMAVVIPATGFLTERYQMRTVFTLAMSLFALGTLVAIIAPGFNTLLVGRVIQAVGTAIVIPLSYTAMSTLVPPSRRGSVMAMNIVATSAAPALGPLFSGMILSRFEWPWLFIAILPLAIATLALGGAAGIAIMFSVMGMASKVYQESGEAVGAAMAQGAQQAYLVGCCFVLVSLVAALFLPKRIAAAGVPLPAH